MEYVDEICKMLGEEKDTFVEKAIKDAISPYLNKDKEFKPIKGKIFPMPYEMQVWENEGAKADNMPKPEKCLILDLGDKYARIYDLKKEQIVKVPISYIEMEA